MEQRPLRLGDIVDDYCPQERRLTNHVVVVILEDVIRKTRCTTCDAEHPYKSGLLPRRRKTPGDGEADTGEPLGTLVKPAAASTTEPDTPALAAAQANGSGAPAPDSNGSAPPGDPAAPSGREDTWPAHRPLIRASLPRTEGEQPSIPRPIPEFTIYQRQGRGGHPFRHQPSGFRENNGNSNGRPERNGNVAGAGDHNFNREHSHGRGGPRFGGGPPAAGPGGPGGPGGDQARHGRRRRRRHGKKPG